MELSSETIAELKAAVDLAVDTYGERSLPELQAEDKLGHRRRKRLPPKIPSSKSCGMCTTASCTSTSSNTGEEHNEVVQRGGLHVIGTERHESRRIDNQLRGRAGRQGDPGSTPVLPEPAGQACCVSSAATG